MRDKKPTRRDQQCCEEEKRHMACTGDRKTMQTKLDLITELAGGNRKLRINNVYYLLNVENLCESYFQLKTGKAAGVDGISIEEYGKKLGSNIKQLAERIRKGAYRPQPVRRTYIPKANGKLRPLGIPAVEDKIVQHCMRRTLWIFHTDSDRVETVIRHYRDLTGRL